MYCLKCKQNTQSKNLTEVITKSNRRMIKSICSNCDNKKSQFIQSVVGTGIGDTIIKAIGKVGELHLPATKGEFVPNGSFNNLQKYSYCGPGTRYEQRVSEGYRGINELDSMCKQHDQFYSENQDTESRNVSDTALAHRANEIANDDRFDEEQRRFARFVNVIMQNKVRFGLGMKSKNLKKGPMKIMQ